MGGRRPPPRRSADRRPAARGTGKAVEAVVESLGGLGDGIARADGGELLYIPRTLPGERVLARIEGKRGDGFAASLIEVLQPAPERTTAPCAHYGECGGCSLQHLAPAAYAAWKRETLVDTLARAGLDAPVAPLLQVPERSRRRATFAYVNRKGGAVLGFNARASHHIIDLADCLLLAPPLSALLAPLRTLLAEVVPGGGQGDVVLTLTDAGVDAVIEAAEPLDLFRRERLAAFAEVHDLARLSWRQAGTRQIEPVAARRIPFVMLGGVAVTPPPGGFLQPSKAGEQAIAALVAAAVGDADPVADLFAGCGSFTFPLSRARVHAVEGEAALVEAIRSAADRAGLGGRITTEQRDLFRQPLVELKQFQAVVFDPPRAGAAAQAEILAQAGPPLVVAVSCNPATLARDLRTLLAGGYSIEQVTPIDQFPWSGHLEAVVVLRR